MSDVGLAIQRAEDKTEQMKARAGAIDELMASGALTDALGGPPPDDIQAELDRMGASHGVDAELERMKAELAGGSAPKQIAGSPEQADSAVGQPGGTSFQKEQPGPGGA
jgi:phage shock protein A